MYVGQLNPLSENDFRKVLVAQKGTFLDNFYDGKVK